ncbi:hypothetical protein TSOC_011152 [Tetrabaena socialis]|uniref:Uncharacterized protein n=1 Tax=Tetrabaena socialis TaxID=47790 RepID=A0A2J7ZRE1_9CHLO|nr:hypothetical protein TSOC_011152 [Tetrabaena socialis]|eukprot:PNH02828.1 hypothetical protein TSOC_011152 [Tetrabaena socialis]
MALNVKGSFSYLNQDVNWVRLDVNLTAKVERVNNNVARVAGKHGYDRFGGQSCPPPFMANFMITWADSYTLTFNGQVVLRLNNQKQQAILALPNAEHGVE